MSLFCKYLSESLRSLVTSNMPTEDRDLIIKQMGECAEYWINRTEYYFNRASKEMMDEMESISAKTYIEEEIENLKDLRKTMSLTPDQIKIFLTTNEGTKQ